MAAPDDNLKVDPSVSIACHPMTLRPEGTALGMENNIYLEAVGALANTYTVLSDMTAANKAAHDENDTRNVQAIQLARRTGTQVPGSVFDVKKNAVVIPLDVNLATNLNESIHSAFVDRLAPRLDSALTMVKAQAASESDKIATALRDPRGATSEAVEYGRDVRAHIKAMPTSMDRVAFCKAAIEAGNIRVVAAVIGTDSFLSGIEDKSAAALRTAAEAKFAPVASKTYAALRAIETKIVDAGRAAIAHKETALVPVREKQTITLAAMNRLRNSKGV